MKPSHQQRHDESVRETVSVYLNHHAATVSRFEESVVQRNVSYRTRESEQLDKSVSDLWLTGEFGDLGPDEIEELVADVRR